MSIGIAITSFNRNKILSETVEKIKRLTKSPYKLVIVDDGSLNPVENATFRFDKNQGAPIAKNKCLELLEGCEHIMLFDDDTFPIKEGWEIAYINSGIKHLNYSFKYPYEVVNWVRHLQNPNGCMMYIHRSVINNIGGYDTGFVKYGYWHGSYSNRAYNVGLIPHPFIDIEKSEDYIYCLDQEPKTHKTSTSNRSKFLQQNKRRYNEKIDSTDYIDYIQHKPIKIWYSNPYSTEKNIGRAYNEFCSLVPDGDFICLTDGDMMYLTSDWGKQIEDVVKENGNKFGLIGCMTNRLGRKTQRIGEMDNNHDMLRHYEIAKKLSKNHYGKVQDVTRQKYVAGMFMLFPKSVWNKVKFRENNISFDDHFSNDVRKKGYKLGLMKGLYVYHLYRAWSDNPSKDIAHLI